MVRADVLRELLLGRRGPLDPRGVRVRGARVTGRLDLDSATTTVGLQLERCVVADPITGHHAHLSWLELVASTVHALHADGAVISDRLLLRDSRMVGSHKSGAIRLVSAHVGVLDLAGIAIVNDVGSALLAGNVRVGGDLRLNHARLICAGDTSTVMLVGAHLGGQLVLDGAEVTNDAGPAVTADGMEVEGSLRLEGARVAGTGDRGAIRLLGVRVGAQLHADRADVSNENGPALVADGLHVVNNARFPSARLVGAGHRGALRLVGARVGGQLNLSGVELTNDTGVLVDLAEAAVSRGVLIEAGLVCPDPTGRGPCAHPARVDVDGFTFGKLARSEWWEWLHVIRCHTPAYRPQPYQQLAAIERSAGHDGNARRVLIAQQKDLYRRAPKALGGWWTRRFHRLWGALAGYGHRARRTATALLLALLAAGGLGLWAGQVVTDDGHHAAERTASFDDRTGETCSTVELIGVGLDRGLPLSPTGVRARCDLDTGTGWGQAFTVAIWLVQAAVWGLATLALAGYTNLIRKTT